MHIQIFAGANPIDATTNEYSSKTVHSFMQWNFPRWLFRWKSRADKTLHVQISTEQKVINWMKQTNGSAVNWVVGLDATLVCVVSAAWMASNYVSNLDLSDKSSRGNTMCAFVEKIGRFSAWSALTVDHLARSSKIQSFPKLWTHRALAL